MGGIGALLATNFGSPQGVLTQDKYVLSLWHITYYLAFPIGAIVGGGFIWCAFRYRVRKGDTRKAPQFQYHVPIETAYTVIPLIIVAVLFGYMYNAENKEDAVSKHPALVVNVDGFQWGWRFTYPNGFQELGSVGEEPNINDDSTLPVLYLPDHETVQLNLISLDVNHSFYVPEFLFKRDLIQGVHNTVDVNVTKDGEYIGECTQLCGTYHSYMRFLVDVMPTSQFNTWLSQQTPDSCYYAGSGQCPGTLP